MQVKEGDVIEFLALEWNEAHWEFDHPTVVLSPVIDYSPNGESADKMIEDLCEKFSVDGEAKDYDTEEEFDWRGWNLQRMKQVAKNRLKGKDDWKSKYARVVYQKVEFYKDKKGEMWYKVIKNIEK